MADKEAISVLVCLWLDRDICCNSSAKPDMVSLCGPWMPYKSGREKYPVALTVHTQLIRTTYSVLL
jgi:hypothetical protein